MKESSRKGSNVSDHPAIIFSLIDITELRADVIVCPAGSNLRYDAGIAGDVMKKAGPGLKRALADLRGRRQPLPVGEAFVTGSFDLKNCDHIIHVVVPKFSEYATEDECAFDLKRACDNSLKQLSEVKRRAPAGKGIVRSMGLATLGSGFNKIPKDIVAKVLCRSVKEFLKKSNGVVRDLQRIYIVSLDEQMLSILEDTWIAEDVAPTRDRPAGREGHGQSEEREKQLSSGIRRFSGKPRPGDHLDSKSEAPVKKYSQSVFYPLRHTTAQPSEFRTANATFFRPSGKGADQSRDGKGGGLHLASNHTDMPGAESKPPAASKDDSDDELDEFYATVKHRNDEPSVSAAASRNYGSKDVYKSASPSPNTPAGVEDTNCPVCLEDLADEPKAVPICGHKVCGDCWKGLQASNPVCPVCRKVYGTLKGNQPKNARMRSKVDPSIHLPGYDPFGTIVIDYSVPNGIQTDEHPNPGKPYKGTTRRAYLPDNREGAKIHEMLKKAFDARLIFTVGQSVTSGTDDVVTWNDIHHKTNISGPSFAYPDPSYLIRVKEELESKGIK